LLLKYESSNSEGITILRSSQSSLTDSNRNFSAIKVPLPWVKIVLGILFPKYNEKISNILS
jgi:hypothetical protein